MEEHGRIIKVLPFVNERLNDIRQLQMECEGKGDWNVREKRCTRRRTNSYKRRGFRTGSTRKRSDLVTRKKRRRNGEWFNNDSKYMSRHKILAKRMEMDSLKNIFGMDIEPWCNLVVPVKNRQKGYKFMNKVFQGKVKDEMCLLFDKSYYFSCVHSKQELEKVLVSPRFDLDHFKSIYRVGDKVVGPVHVIRLPTTEKWQMLFNPLLFSSEDFRKQETVVLEQELFRLCGSGVKNLLQKAFPEIRKDIATWDDIQMYSHRDITFLIELKPAREVVILFPPSYSKSSVKELFMRIITCGGVLGGVQVELYFNTMLGLPAFPMDYPHTVPGEKYWCNEVSKGVLKLKNTPLSKIGFKVSSCKQLADLFAPNWNSGTFSLSAKSTSGIIVHTSGDSVGIFPVVLTLDGGKTVKNASRILYDSKLIGYCTFCGFSQQENNGNPVKAFGYLFQFFTSLFCNGLLHVDILDPVNCLPTKNNTPKKRTAVATVYEF